MDHHLRLGNDPESSQSPPPPRNRSLGGPGTLVRAYKFWPGLNRPLLGGRCITGPRSDTLFNLFTWSAIMGISALFMGVSGPTLWEDVSPALVIVVAACWVLTTTLLALTQFSDPGIIPRQSYARLIEPKLGADRMLDLGMLPTFAGVDPEDRPMLDGNAGGMGASTGLVPDSSDEYKLFPHPDPADSEGPRDGGILGSIAAATASPSPSQQQYDQHNPDNQSSAPQSPHRVLGSPGSPGMPHTAAESSSQPVSQPVPLPALTTDAPIRVWCHTCQLLRPPRASHCPLCDCCMERLDHHCPFVGNCVAARNHPYFLGFLWSLTMQTVLVTLGFSLGMAKAGESDRDDDDGGDGGGSKTPAGLMALVYVVGAIVGFIGLVLLGFSAFHLCLVLCGRTTREQIKGIHPVAASDSDPAASSSSAQDSSQSQSSQSSSWLAKLARRPSIIYLRALVQPPPMGAAGDVGNDATMQDAVRLGRFPRQ